MATTARDRAIIGRGTMASKYWLKMYHEALYDPKLACLPDNLWRRFWECCLMAADADEGGFLPAVEHMAWIVRVSADTLRSELGQMAQSGFVELCLDASKVERWYVTNFSKRQEAQTSTERWRKWRDRQRQAQFNEEPTNAKPKSNATPTNRLTDKEEDIDTEVETDKEQERGPHVPAHLATTEFMNAWGEWLGYHDDRGTPPTQATINKQFKLLEQYDQTTMLAMIDRSITNGWTGLFPLKESETSANGGTLTDMVKERIKAHEMANRSE